MQKYDVLVIGCGLSGAVCARYIAENFKKKVHIIERREHIGGNMYDYYDDHGILVQKYGPHTFHTNNEQLYDYICRFSKWIPYELQCMAHFCGKTTPTPFNFATIDEYYSQEEAAELKKRIKMEFRNQETATVEQVLKSNDQKIKEYAQFLFDHDYSLYTAKQWGISAKEIDPSVLKRVPLRFSYGTSYFTDRYQVMPKFSYIQFFDNLLSHPNITVQLGIEAMQHLTVSREENKIFWDGSPVEQTVIYTGALDELFHLCEGALPYRSLRFEFIHEEIDSKQPAAIVAYPEAKYYTRITEYKKLTNQVIKGTTYAIEYPLKYKADKKFEPYYPVLTQNSQKTYEKYCNMAEKIPNLVCCGRLADFKYYNMDQALERALDVASKIF